MLRAAHLRCVVAAVVRVGVRVRAGVSVPATAAAGMGLGDLGGTAATESGLGGPANAAGRDARARIAPHRGEVQGRGAIGLYEHVTGCALGHFSECYSKIPPSLPT